MIRRLPLSLIILLLPALAACEESYSISLRLILDGAHEVGPGETLAADVWIADGRLRLADGAQVDGSIYILPAGALEIDGEVTGDVAVLDGALALGPGARVGGDLNLAGGNLNVSPEAQIGGRVVREPPAASRAWQDRLPANQLIWHVGSALLLAGLAYAGVRVAPRPVARVARAAVGHAILSGALGLLSGVVGLALLVQMAFTVILIPVSLLGLGLLFGAVAYGWVAIGCTLGRRLRVRRAGRDLSPRAKAALGTGLFVLIVNLLGLLPLVPGIVPLLAASVGLGAVLLTRFGLRPYVPPVDSEPAWPD